MIVRRLSFPLVLSCVVLASNALVVFFGVRGLIAGREHAEDLTSVQTRNLAEAIDQSITVLVKRIDHSLVTVVGELETDLKEGHLDVRELERFIKIQEGLLPEAVAIRVTDETGKVVIGNVGTDPSASLADRPFFPCLKAGTCPGLYITRPIVGYFTRQWVVTSARRYDHPDGRFAGVVVVPVRVEQFQKLLSTFDVGTAGTLTLRDLDAGFITRHPLVVKGKTLEGGDQNISRELLEILRSGVTAKTYFAETPHDRVRRILTFKRMATAPMIVVAGLAEEDYLAQWRRDVRVTAGVTAAFLVLTWLMLWQLWQMWKGRERDAAAHQEVEVRRKTEEALRKLNVELEHRVQSRTEELTSANVELEHALRTKDEFLASMSHELRTPLSAILGLSEALLQGVYGPPTERQIRAIKIVEDSGRHLLELINDILDLSKIEAGRLQIRTEPIAVGSLCSASLTLVQQAAARKKISLTSSIDPNALMVWADPKRLKQVLVNLLSNAVKFTPEGGSISLQVKGDQEADVIRFQVSDTGIGIAPADMKRLFRPFVQVDSSLARRQAGTGLGLALTHRLTALQGGGIEAHSDPGKGSTFTVSLPWPEEQRTSRGAVFRVSPEPPETPPLAARTNSPARVLLVEDSEANIETLSSYLRAMGHRVTVARNGAEALGIGPGLQPDIVLMDIQMPGMDGLEVTRRFRKHPLLERVPIIAVTALAMVGDRERCLEAGADAFLSKPLQLSKLLRMIEEKTSRAPRPATEGTPEDQKAG